MSDYNFSMRCRACLLENGEMFPLCDVYENNMSLATIIQNILRVEIDTYDAQLPKNLCQECTTVVINFYNFSVVFEENTKKLEALLTYAETAITEDGIVYEISETENKEDVENLNEYSEQMHASCNDANEAQDGEIIEIKSVEIFSDGQFEITEPIQNKIEKLEGYSCDLCDKMYFDQCDFNEHHQCEHGDEIMRKTAQKQAFEERCLFKRRLKHKNQKFICEFCGYICTKKSYLIDHMEIHSDEKPYKCSFCGKSFKRRAVFSRHKRIHTNPKGIICEICGKSFTHNSTLKTHIMLLHVRSRNFSCIICNQSFPLKSTLAKHLRRHKQREGAKKNYTCSECNMQYFDKSSLTRHYVIKHSAKYNK